MRGMFKLGLDGMMMREMGLLLVMMRKLRNGVGDFRGSKLRELRNIRIGRGRRVRRRRRKRRKMMMMFLTTPMTKIMRFGNKKLQGRVGEELWTMRMKSNEISHLYSILLWKYHIRLVSLKLNQMQG